MFFTIISAALALIQPIQPDSTLINISDKPDSVQAHTYIEAAKRNLNNPLKADSLALLAFSSAQKGGTLNQLGEAAFLICFSNLERDFAKSEKWADTSVLYFERANNFTWAGYVVRNMGLQAGMANKPDAGLGYLQRALYYFEKVSDTLMIAHTHASISLAYHNYVFDYPKGLEYGLKGLQILEQMQQPDKAVKWVIQNAIAINYDDNNQHTEALDYHFRNIAYSPSDKRLGSTYNNIGNSYKKLKRFNEAEKYFIKGISLTKRTDDNDLDYALATVYNNLSHISWELKRRHQAEAYRDSAIFHSLKSNHPQKLLETYYDSYLMCEKHDDYKNASRFLKTYLTIKDSVFTAEKQKTVYELEQKYETAKKEEQIAKLEAQTRIQDLELTQSRATIIIVITLFGLTGTLLFLLYKRSRYKQHIAHIRETEELQRQRFTAVLEAEENERSRVAKDLHDGIGQLLSVAKLTLSAVEDEREDNMRMIRNSMSVLDQATKEVRAISHNMMPAALTDIGLSAALEDLFVKVNEAKLLQIKLEANGLEERLPLSVEIAVYRVIQEVVNNMIKHSKADKINVRIRRQGAAVSLAISDNGIGFEKEVIAKSKGLGWKNILSRISMLNGEIEVDSQPGAGTSVSIQFAIT